jgi:hypothetical protein
MNETTIPNGPLTDAAEVVTMPKEDALEKFNEYKAAVRISRSQHDRMMKAVYGALSEGLGVINPRQAILKAGFVDEINMQPKLAICRADQDTVYFRREHGDNAAYFSSYPSRFISRANQKAQRERHQFHFASGQLPQLEKWNWKDNPLYTGATVKATVPIISPEHRPQSGAIGEYSILWEVEKWEALPRPQRAPGDPMLLKPLAHTGLYAVMAHWDLTVIEKWVLGAMFGN